MKLIGNKSALVALLTSSIVLISGCQSTASKVSSVGPSMVGPGAAQPLASSKPVYTYNSAIFLNVAVPVFDPGFPMDGNVINYDEIEEEGIWPQVRRLEANRFAIATKEALSETNAFGSIHVTPDASAVADVYVLGNIITSDTETVELNIKVMDAKNTVWDEESFEYRVSEGWYRDAMSRGENPNGPIFTEVATFVYNLLMQKNEVYKKEIQQVATLRYANMYSPENFSKYLDTSRKGVIELVSMPSENDRMLQRVEAIQTKDEQFLDQLQDSYETFWMTTEQPYRDYQRETLPEAKRIRELQAERTQKQVVGGLLAIGSALLGKNSDSSLGQATALAAGVGAVASIASAVKTNKELQTQRKLFDEMGQNLDIEVAEQIVEFNDQRIELQGTATEQYYQLRSHLKEIYEMESTPLVAL